MVQNWDMGKSRYEIDIPFGKHIKNYGKSLFLVGKSTISMAIFNSYVTNYQRVPAVKPGAFHRLVGWPKGESDTSQKFYEGCPSHYPVVNG